jgi:3-deoxy-manno-octulosonate cytidylyltransferase (CMP-KDO synthetase)
MIKVAMIPARYAATRFPFKLMQPLGSKTVIRQTYDNTLETGLFDEVYVVTDHEIIFEEINKHGGRAIMSGRAHESGSDRIAEAIKDMHADVILNVQGDEPFVQKESLGKLLNCFNDDTVQVASLMRKFNDVELVNDPNYVKVVVNSKSDAMYFSRSAIPFARDKDASPCYFEHIGVYAYRKEALLQFTQWPASKLEAAEKLEQLRYLENGVTIRMIETQETTVKIDVPADLQNAENYLKSLQS